MFGNSLNSANFQVSGHNTFEGSQQFLQKIEAKPFYLESEQHSTKSKSTRGSGSSIGDGEDY